MLSDEQSPFVHNINIQFERSFLFSELEWDYEFCWFNGCISGPLKWSMRTVTCTKVHHEKCSNARMNVGRLWVKETDHSGKTKTSQESLPLS